MLLRFLLNFKGDQYENIRVFASGDKYEKQETPFDFHVTSFMSMSKTFRPLNHPD